LIIRLTYIQTEIRMKIYNQTNIRMKASPKRIFD